MTVRHLVVAAMCVARAAYGEPPIAGHVALGLRTSSTSNAHYGVYDDTGPVRASLDGLVGFVFGPVTVGMHAGIGTPLSFDSSPLADSGEQVATATSKIYPVDIGVGGQVDVGGGVWISAWLGATISFAYASSPAMHVNAIDFFGDIPAASWSDDSTSVGYGAAVGYDVANTGPGRVAAVLAVESQGIARIPARDNTGGLRSEQEDLSCRSLTLGVAYRY